MRLVGCSMTGGGVRCYPQNCPNKPPCSHFANIGWVQKAYGLLLYTVATQVAPNTMCFKFLQKNLSMIVKLSPTTHLSIDKTWLWTIALFKEIFHNWKHLSLCLQHKQTWAANLGLLSLHCILDKEIWCNQRTSNSNFFGDSHVWELECAKDIWQFGKGTYCTGTQ
jgi:hypothetical protein